MRPSRLPYVLAPGLFVAVALACGGGQVSEDPPPVCYLSHPIPDGGMMRPIRQTEWASLVVRNWSQGSTATQDCVGDNIEWRPTDRQCEVHEPEDERPPRAVPITDESIVVGRGDTVAVKPVWVITHRFENEDGFGPVVITERTSEGVAVRAIGTLRLPVERARLRLRETGGQRILVADGERCPPQDEDPDAPENVPQQGEDEQPPTCLRSSRLLPMVGDRLLNPEVRDPENNRCLGPALVHLSREHVVGLANGWERVFRVAASLEYQGASIVIHEQVTAEDRDPRDPGRPPLQFRTSDADRVILLDRGGMRSRGIPLFDRAIRAHGSTQLPVGDAPRQEASAGGQQPGKQQAGRRRR